MEWRRPAGRPSGQLVEFSIVTSSSNAQRMKMATLLQDDLAQLGMQVHVVPLDFRATIDRVFQSFDYEAAIMGLGGGDADPNPEMNVWLSSGSTHLWHMGETQPSTSWEREIDQLMNEQMVTLNYQKRKKLYDRVQQIISEQLPFVSWQRRTSWPGQRLRSAISSQRCLTTTRCGMPMKSIFAARKAQDCGEDGSEGTTRTEEPSSDDRLIALCRKGDQQAWARTGR